MTREELIEQLQKMPPGAIIITENDGEYYLSRIKEMKAIVILHPDGEPSFMLYDVGSYVNMDIYHALNADATLVPAIEID